MFTHSRGRAVSRRLSRPLLAWGAALSVLAMPADAQGADLAPPAEPAASPRLAPSAPTAPPDVLVKISGRMELEAAVFDGVMNTQGIEPGRRLGELSGDLYNRRTWLAVTATVAEDWVYQLQFDYRDLNDKVGVNDLTAHYLGFGDSFHITIGKMKEPFTFGDWSSSKYRTFGELGLGIATWETGRNYGLMLSGAGARLSYGAGVFDNGNDLEKHLLPAFTGRVAYAFVNGSEYLVHLGGAFSYRDSSATSWTQGLGIGAGNNLSLLYARATSQVSGTLEVLGRAGPAHLESEFIDVHSQAAGAGSDTNGYAYYVQAAAFLTGERRPYRAGVWQAVEPLASFGALEVGARGETMRASGDALSLSTGAAAEPPILLGALRTSSARVAFNYYSSSHVRIGVNAVYTWLSKPIGGEDRALGLAARMWIHF